MWGLTDGAGGGSALPALNPGRLCWPWCGASGCAAAGASPGSLQKLQRLAVGDMRPAGRGEVLWALVSQQPCLRLRNSGAP